MQHHLGWEKKSVTQIKRVKLMQEFEEALGPSGPKSVR